ncbi:hypothetical protein ACFQV2_27585 [Actinokineospora soli]|uniref:Uncharacterized protein n=1 Tax=Actinokineospora soli TaxID=1048753 RepID=A0ABW2TUJ7_9PSEU
MIRPNTAYSSGPPAYALATCHSGRGPVNTSAKCSIAPHRRTNAASPTYQRQNWSPAARSSGCSPNTAAPVVVSTANPAATSAARAAARWA